MLDLLSIRPMDLVGKMKSVDNRSDVVLIRKGVKKARLVKSAKTENEASARRAAGITLTALGKTPHFFKRA